MATAMPSKNRDGWVGRAFSGGAFFEARIAFNPADINHEKGWPAFWSIGLAHLAPNNQDQWPGEVTGYKRFLENDFFEYATARFAGRNSYGATLHDWHGIYNKTCASGYCDLNNTKNGGSGFSNFVITPARPVNWTEFHTIGQLWVPSKANGEEGYIQNYFDGKLMSRISWNKSILTAAPPSGRTVFNIADTSNLVLILSTGENQPMHIDWVHVWQLNSKQDER